MKMRESEWRAHYAPTPTLWSFDAPPPIIRAVLASVPLGAADAVAASRGDKCSFSSFVLH